MSPAGSDKIQFRGTSEKEALDVVNEIRLGGINASELAREGLREMLQRAITDQERMKIHQLYEQGELSEEATRILLGDDVDEIEREREAFEAAMELETDGIYQE